MEFMEYTRELSQITSVFLLETHELSKITSIIYLMKDVSSTMYNVIK